MIIYKNHIKIYYEVQMSIYRYVYYLHGIHIKYRAMRIDGERETERRKEGRMDGWMFMGWGGSEKLLVGGVRCS